MTAPGESWDFYASGSAVSSGSPPLGWSLFMLGATYGHIRETVLNADYAPYNFLTMFSDGFIAIWLLVLLYLYYRLGGFRS